MKFGFLLKCDVDFKQAIEQSVLIEKLGYDSIWIPEHHGYEGNYVPHPLIALAALATVTQRVTLGPYVLLLPLYHPVLVAEQAAMADLISNGRLILGLGVGYVTEEFESMSVPYKERGGRMEEGLPLIKRLWNEDVVHHDGKYYKFKNAKVYPRPVQKDLPIWVGAWVETAIRRAARLADGWVPGPTADYQVLEYCYRIYRDELQKVGKPLDIEYAACRELYIAPTKEEARKRGESLYELYKHTYLQWPHPWLKERERGLSYAELVKDRFIIGDPDDCIQAIKTFSTLGINHFIFRVQEPGVSHEQALDQINLFAREVMPEFKHQLVP